MSQNTWVSWIAAIPDLVIVLTTWFVNCFFLISCLLLQFSLLDFDLGFATVPLLGGLLPLLLLYCYSIGWQIHLLKWFITPAHWAVAVITEQPDLSVYCTGIFMVCNRCCGMGSTGNMFVIAKEKNLKEQGARQMSRQMQKRESKEGFNFPVLEDIN